VHSQVVANRPLVSIGLPVFNSAQYLDGALKFLLDQTYRNIEFIISDNASTDETPDICARYASLDRRIRYSRLPVNEGSIPNHNRVFSLATGTYFMWASHDDLFFPSYVEKCVEGLESDASAVLAYSRVGIIDESGHVQSLMVEPHSADAPRAAERFKEFMDLYSVLEAFYGLIRREVLEKTMLQLAHPGSDRILLAELSLHGRFVQIPEYLFQRRIHERQSAGVYPNIRDRYVWVSPALKDKRMFPHWGYLAGYTRAILRTPLSLRDKALCAIEVLRLIRYSWRELLDDLKA